MVKRKIIFLLVGVSLFIKPTLAIASSSYSTSDIFNPVIDNAAKTFNIDIYVILSIVAVFVIILAILFASVIIKKILFEPFKNRNVLNSNISSRKIKSVDPSLDVKEFKEFAFEKFKGYCDAFTAFDFSLLKEQLSNNLYEEEVLELESLKKRNLRNIISNVKNVYCQINNIQVINNVEKVDIILTTQSKDYIVNISDSDVVMSGSKRDIQEKTYLITFIKEELHAACLKCGGEVQNDHCLYCRAINTQKESNWVISKIKLLKQRTLGK